MIWQQSINQQQRNEQPCEGDRALQLPPQSDRTSIESTTRITAFQRQSNYNTRYQHDALPAIRTNSGQISRYKSIEHETQIAIHHAESSNTTIRHTKRTKTRGTDECSPVTTTRQPNESEQHGKIALPTCKKIQTSDQQTTGNQKSEPHDDGEEGEASLPWFTAGGEERRQPEDHPTTTRPRRRRISERFPMQLPKKERRRRRRGWRDRGFRRRGNVDRFESHSLFFFFFSGWCDAMSASFQLHSNIPDYNITPAIFTSTPFLFPFFSNPQESSISLF